MQDLTLDYSQDRTLDSSSARCDPRPPHHGARCCEPSLCQDVESPLTYLLETLMRYFGVPKNALTLAGFSRERNLTNGSNPATGQTGSAAATSGAAASTNVPPVPSIPPLVNPLGFIQSSLAGITVDDLLNVASHVIIFPSGAGHCSTQGT
jgi:hypothetical protein